MIWFFAVVAVIAFAALLSQPAPGRARARRRDVADDQAADDPDALELDDPVEALRRYGTPEDAARLSSEGVDLTALGWRPPET